MIKNDLDVRKKMRIIVIVGLSAMSFSILPLWEIFSLDYIFLLPIFFAIGAALFSIVMRYLQTSRRDYLFSSSTPIHQGKSRPCSE